MHPMKVRGALLCCLLILPLVLLAQQPALTIGLFIYQGFNTTKLALDELGLVEDHYRGLSQKYGYEIPVPEYYYQKFARQRIMIYVATTS